MTTSLTQDERLDSILVSWAARIEDLQQRRDIAVSDLQGLLDSDVPLSATAETMIRSAIATLTGGQ